MKFPAALLCAGAIASQEEACAGRRGGSGCCASEVNDFICVVIGASGLRRAGPPIGCDEPAGVGFLIMSGFCYAEIGASELRLPVLPMTGAGLVAPIKNFAGV